MNDRTATYGIVESSDRGVVVNCPVCRRVMWANGWCRGCLNDAEVVTHGPLVGGSAHHSRVGRALADRTKGEG